MISRDDLTAAVEAGIMTDDQVSRLSALAARRSGSAIPPTSHDEPFRLFRGFRDFFIAIGLALLAVGLGGSVILFFNVDAITGRAGDAGQAALAALVLAGVAWLFGELVTRRLRLPLSSIVIVAAFAICAGVAGFFAVQAFNPGLDIEVALMAGAICAVAGTFLFYMRFGLPFALLPLAAAAVIFLFAMVESIAPGLVEDNLAILAGIAGLCVFAAAMTYDMSDPQRLSRRSECAFWLHLLAAPLLVHSAVGGLTGFELDNAVAVRSVAGLIIILGLVALLVDRRALLVSALVYLGTVISFAVGESGLSGGEQSVTTLAGLGALTVVLGLGWTPARNRLIGLFPDTALTRRLPPAGA